MTWSKFDDLYDEHEKVEDAWDSERATVGMHVMATTHCNRMLTDGVVQPRWLRRKLPTVKERDRVMRAAVAAGLFDLLPAGETLEVMEGTGRKDERQPVTLGPFPEDRYIVHDFLDRHDSRRQVEQRRDDQRDKKRNAGKAGADARWSKQPDATVPSADGKTDGSGAITGMAAVPSVPLAAAEPEMAPDPTRPDPTLSPPDPPTGGDGDDGGNGKVVSFDRRPVPKPRLALAERLLDDFNTAAGTRHNAYTGRGKPTESLKRIIGALTDHPNVSLDQWQAAIRWRIAHPFWDGKPDTGVVFGPGAVQGNLASSMQSRPANAAAYRSKLLGDPA